MDLKNTIFWFPILECKEYFDRSQKKVEFSLLPNEQTVQKTLDRCENSGKAFIVGGTPAAPKEFPHQVCLAIFVCVNEIPITIEI